VRTLLSAQLSPISNAKAPRCNTGPWPFRFEEESQHDVQLRRTIPANLPSDD
jgi:hypothetical protein